MRISLFVTSLLLLGCAAQPLQEEAFCGDYPCWVVRSPGEGIVVSMAEHVDPSKTREVLFNKALVELAVGADGIQVSQDTIVKKTVSSVGDAVAENAQVINLASVTTGGTPATIKAKIKAQWQDPLTRKLYLWVVSIQ